MQEAIKKLHARRSIRRFTQDALPREAIADMLESARLSPTGTNQQPLSFVAVTNASLCSKLFPYTKWAALLQNEQAKPDASTQPTGYIALLIDQTIRKEAAVDAGAAAMSIILTAQLHGIASCWLANIDRDAIMRLLNFPTARYALHSIIALGYPAMHAKAVPLAEDESTAYYLDANFSLCVPKRAAKNVIQWIE